MFFPCPPVEFLKDEYQIVLYAGLLYSTTTNRKYVNGEKKRFIIGILPIYIIRVLVKDFIQIFIRNECIRKTRKRSGYEKESQLIFALNE